MKCVLTFAAAMLSVSMFAVGTAQAGHHSSGGHCSSGHCNSGYCNSHHGNCGHGSGHCGSCGNGKCGGGMCGSGKCGNPDGWNTIHPIPAPNGGNTGSRLPIHVPVAFGNLSGNLAGKDSGHGLYTGSLNQWGLTGGKGLGTTTGMAGGPGRPTLNNNNGQIPNIGTGFAGFSGAAGQEIGGAVTSVLNAGGALVGGVANGVGSVLGGLGSAIGDIF